MEELRRGEGVSKRERESINLLRLSLRATKEKGGGGRSGDNKERRVRGGED